MDRIISLRVSNPCAYDLVLSLIEKMLPFNRIECLILQRIEPDCLENLLHQLLSLSKLCSLIIATTDSVQNRAKIYRQIFRLRALKYCKLSLSKKETNRLLSTCVSEYSPIEYLIITSPVYLDEFDSLLSYVPQVRRLSLFLYEGTRSRRSQRYPFVCRQLTQLSLQLSVGINFDLFGEITRELFRMIEVLHLTLPYYFDRPYMNANKWEHLIIAHLPYLRIFDIQCTLPPGDDISLWDTTNLISQFTTSFWIARQWSFAYQPFGNRHKEDDLFYSTNPYRYLFER